GVDRFMSEARALTSLASNAVATVVVSLSENACDRQTLHRRLNGEPLASPVAESPEWAAEARRHG
ncbi:MAG: dicarboxylate/amino acid:cation symporter, partial [Pseudomonas sp.]